MRAVHEDEAAARAAVHRSAWRPRRIGELFVPPIDLGDAGSSMTTDSYQSVMNAWPYRHDLDQVVEAPDGTLVAFALGWLDEVNQGRRTGAGRDRSAPCPAGIGVGGEHGVPALLCAPLARRELLSTHGETARTPSRAICTSGADFSQSHEHSRSAVRRLRQHRKGRRPCSRTSH